MPSKQRNRRYRHDTFYRRAKQESFVARSVYKLEELDQRFQLLRPGIRVLDLGCAPGSWMQYAATRIGARGLVVGVDRFAPRIALEPNMRAVQADVFSLTPEALGCEAASFDLILSDMAPDTSGIGFTDQVRSAALLQQALDLALLFGRPGCSFVGKVLMGHDFDAVVASAKSRFDKTKVVKPEASRKESTEVYLVAQGRKGTPPSSTDQGAS